MGTNKCPRPAVLPLPGIITGRMARLQPGQFETLTIRSENIHITKMYSDKRFQICKFNWLVVFDLAQYENGGASYVGNQILVLFNNHSFSFQHR